MLKSMKILTCGLVKSSAGKESDSREILANKKPNGKETKTPDPERVQRPSPHEVFPAADNKPLETDLARPPTDTGEQNAFTSLLPRVPTVPPGNMSLPSSRIGTSHSKHKDLWDEAYTKLRLENPNLFKKYTRCIMNIEDSQQPELTHDIDHLESDERERYLATLIEKRLQTIHKEKWPTATKVYKKTVNTVLFAKDFITQVASNEPHAALAWAGVSLLLPVSGRLSYYFQRLVKGKVVLTRPQSGDLHHGCEIPANQSSDNILTVLQCGARCACFVILLGLLIMFTFKATVETRSTTSGGDQRACRCFRSHSAISGC